MRAIGLSTLVGSPEMGSELTVKMAGGTWGGRRGKNWDRQKPSNLDGPKTL